MMAEVVVEVGLDYEAVLGYEEALADCEVVVPDCAVVLVPD